MPLPEYYDMMYIPSSTYRIQFSADFTFKDLRSIIPYLDHLGVSTIYASPIFKARKGSSHGYDITDPLQLNPEIGTLEEWRDIIDELKKRNMGWLQDIVPNHMAFDSANDWLQNVFQFGSQSSYYSAFDIDWNHPNPRFKGKLMAPFLGKEEEAVMASGELKLIFKGNLFFVQYYEHQYTTSIHTYPLLWKKVLPHLPTGKAKKALTNLIDETEERQASVETWPSLYDNFLKLLEDGKISDTIPQVLAEINSSPQQLSQILSLQHFRFTYWKTTEKEINYRRFFTINDLICLRMEDEKVFHHYHSFIKHLCQQKLIDGLRVDHIDGLLAPKEYLQRLRKLVGEDSFIIVEKILESGETLAPEWPVQGTTGYDFLAATNQLLTNKAAEFPFKQNYNALTLHKQDFENLAYNQKAFICQNRMGGELANLYRLMEKLELWPEQNHSSPALRQEALKAFLCSFSSYRFYPDSFPLSQSDQEILHHAHRNAIEKIPSLRDEVDYILALFCRQGGGDIAAQLHFTQRCQQFTGPLTAKGIEDTTFYLYNLLISHNEVGDSPHFFGITVDDFHHIVHTRQDHFPYSINTTSTHDTKRGEDARMRINVLSEIPEQWFAKVYDWIEMNASLKEQQAIPDANEEYFLYQALIGAWPAAENPENSFKERTQNYLQKILREAKIHSSWSAPDEVYEQATLDFIDAILQSQRFRKSFDPFVRNIMAHGKLLSLVQLVLKITAPGIPDIYQGTELWDLSYVDPDNRRPVDYAFRQNHLINFKNKGIEDDLLKNLYENISGDTIKMFVMQRLLHLRRAHPDLFAGHYLPIKNNGENIISFMRKANDKWLWVIAPCQVMSLFEASSSSLSEIWKNEHLSLPEGAPVKWQNLLTGKEITATNTLGIEDLFHRLPMAVLINFNHEI